MVVLTVVLMERPADLLKKGVMSVESCLRKQFTSHVNGGRRNITRFTPRIFILHISTFTYIVSILFN